MSFADRMRKLFRLKQTEIRQDKDYHVNRLLQHIDNQLINFSVGMEQQVENAAAGKTALPSRSIDYTIQDTDGSELQTAWQDRDYVSLNSVKNLHGYIQLNTKTQALGLTLKLQEEHCDEFDDEQRFRYIIQISGW